MTIHMGNLKTRARKTSRKQKRRQTDAESLKEAKGVKVGSKEVHQETSSHLTPNDGVCLGPVDSIPAVLRQYAAVTPLSCKTVSCSSTKSSDGFVLFSTDVLRSLFSVVSCPGCKIERLSM